MFQKLQEHSLFFSFRKLFTKTRLFLIRHLECLNRGKKITLKTGLYSNEEFPAASDHFQLQIRKFSIIVGSICKQRKFKMKLNKIIFIQ